uniref:Ovule protein n=1 Tax=Anisakis simplex TaxID=6269 RepID=A0A0M3KJG0_ANISI
LVLPEVRVAVEVAVEEVIAEVVEVEVTTVAMHFRERNTPMEEVEEVDLMLQAVAVEAVVLILARKCEPMYLVTWVQDEPNLDNNNNNNHIPPPMHLCTISLN